MEDEADRIAEEYVRISISQLIGYEKTAVKCYITPEMFYLLHFYDFLGLGVLNIVSLFFAMLSWLLLLPVLPVHTYTYISN